MSASATLGPVGDLRKLADDADAMQAVGRLYDQLDRDIARHRPLCWNRGACCRFGQFGHRLYVTTLELAYFLHHRPRAETPSPRADRCPYQVDGRCTARTARPAGCRIFFCEPASRSWQPELTEGLLRRLRNLHDERQIPYIYLDWIAALEHLAGNPELDR